MVRYMTTTNDSEKGMAPTGSGTRRERVALLTLAQIHAPKAIDRCSFASDGKIEIWFRVEVYRGAKRKAVID